MGRGVVTPELRNPDGVASPKNQWELRGCPPLRMRCLAPLERGASAHLIAEVIQQRSMGE